LYKENSTVFVSFESEKQNVMQVKRKPTAGRLLISEPFLQDMHFQRSVVLIADYSQEGAFGLVINKPIETRLSEVMDEFSDFDPVLYLGGPVQTTDLFFIHGYGNEIKGSYIIKDNLAWGGDIRQVKEMIAQGKIHENKIRFFVGYSGWSPHQLDEELKRKSWVVAEHEVNNLFSQDPENLWEQSLTQLGSVYKQWVNFPVNPLYN
jgi:putative transcriptional regulator